MPVEPDFGGCLSVEQYLIDNKLVRYRLREEVGLEVLFGGIERIQDLHSEVFNGYNAYIDINDHSSIQTDVLKKENFDLETKFVNRELEGADHVTPDFFIKEALQKRYETTEDIVPQFMYIGAGPVGDLWLQDQKI